MNTCKVGRTRTPDARVVGKSYVLAQRLRASGWLPNR